MTEHVQFELEGRRSAADAATLLRSIADGLDAGTELSFGEGSATVDVPDELDLELELEGEDRIELEVEFGWERVGGAPAEEREAYQNATGETSTVEAGGGEVAQEDVSIDEDEVTTEGDDGSEGTESDGEVEDASDVREETTVEFDPEALTAEDPAEEAPVTAEGVSSLARFEVYEGRDGKWRWRLVHRNGNIVATGGQGYTRRHNALKGLRSVVRNAAGADIERK